MMLQRVCAVVIDRVQVLPIALIMAKRIRIVSFVHAEENTTQVLAIRAGGPIFLSSIVFDLLLQAALHGVQAREEKTPANVENRIT